MRQSTLIALGIAVVAPVLPAEVAGWELLWADEFDYAGPPDPARWTHQLGAGGWGNNEVQTYTDLLENARVEDGRLIIEVHQKTGGRSPAYTSARLITREKGQWRYGRMEIRARVPRETGTWSAIWMLAADTMHSEALWPDNGEIDIMEHVGYNEDPLFKAIHGGASPANIHGTLHTAMRNGMNNQGVGGSRLVAGATEDFHTYAVNWFADRIEFEVDGEVYNTIQRADLVPARNPPADPWQYWPFNQRFFLILNVAVGGNWGGVFNSTLFPGQSPYGADGIHHDGVWPQRMEIDYVRIYGPPPQAQPTPVPGRVPAGEMDASQGILLQKSDNAESPHHLAYIDAGDWAEFVLAAPAAGTYQLSAAVASALVNRSLNIDIAETGATLAGMPVPNTGGWKSWQTLDLGSVPLQQGGNTLRLSTSTGGFNLAWFGIQAQAGWTWKGLAVDAAGNADSGSWLGPIHVTHAPWLYAFRWQKYVYPTGALGDTFHTGSQWIFVPNRVSSLPADFKPAQ